MVASVPTSEHLVTHDELPFCYPRGHKGQSNLFYVTRGYDFKKVYHILPSSLPNHCSCQLSAQLLNLPPKVACSQTTHLLPLESHFLV